MSILRNRKFNLYNRHNSLRSIITILNIILNIKLGRIFV